MNIVFILNSTFPCYSGGRENWLFHVSSKLTERGHNVHAVTINPKKNNPTHYELPPGFHLFLINVPLYHGIGEKLFRGPFRVIRSAFIAYAFRRKLKDILAPISNPHVITLDTVVTPLAFSSNLRDSTVNICANKGPHAEVMAAKSPLLKPLFFFLEKRAYALADEVWSNGYDMKEYISRQGYRSIMVGNGIDLKAWEEDCSEPDEYRKLVGKKRIVSIGTILPIKGVVEAVKAISVLKDDAENDFHLVWVGKGNSDPYQKIANSIGIGENVDFIGSRKDVRPYAKYSDVLLCLSGGGGLSMAALESMASGIPVVAWDTSVYRQMIRDGESGFLVPYGDIGKLAAVINKAVGLSGSKRDSIISRAKAVTVTYDWDAIVSRIEKRLFRIKK